MKTGTRYNVTQRNASDTIYMIHGEPCVGVSYLYKHYAIPNRTIYPRHPPDYAKNFPKPVPGIVPNRWRVGDVEQWMDGEHG